MSHQSRGVYQTFLLVEFVSDVMEFLPEINYSQSKLVSPSYFRGFLDNMLICIRIELFKATRYFPEKVVVKNGGR